MNIWALDKDLRIKHLLLLLSDRLGAQSFAISTEPVVDAMSVRIFKPGEADLSAYLYTHGQDEERYGVHLEYPVITEISLSKSIEMQEGLDFEQLVDLLQMHLM
jgi:hypothetical protein